MKKMRLILSLLSLFVWVSFASAQDVEKSRVYVTTTERIPFPNGVSIHLKDTFGEVFVEGWSATKSKSN